MSSYSADTRKKFHAAKIELSQDKNVYNYWKNFTLQHL